MACLLYRNFVLVLLCVVSAAPALADSDDRDRKQAWEHPWTVATMSPDGSWGVATEIYMYRAIAGAVSNCRRMSPRKIGCGAQLKAIRAGWIVAVRCGDTNIIVADNNIVAARAAAGDREIALRLTHAGDGPRCHRVITVSPQGIVIHHAPDTDQPGAAVSQSGAR